ncbi:cholinesterase [Phyllosticta citrichinensis]|uniref:Carboxylic ester hydrolase n=1 Tax=Phyllosticta citrichinensis TaxID=1130410 RepID=A0ABR1Y4U1_9PEZI
MMVPQRLISGLTAWALLSPVLATPSPESVGSDVYILLHNHLLGAPSTGDAALVLSNLQTHDEAVLTCAALGEGLWEPPTTKNASSEIGLSYLAYADPSARDSDYWVQKAAAGSCRAITQDGVVYDVDCSNKLAALCSNSAGLALANTTDTSSQWQTRVKTGNFTLTGYRDRHSFRFLGIRYAAQPERFTHSTLYSGSTNAPALEFSPLCVQTDCDATTCSEDCLFLNIWTPYLPKGGASQSTKLKPVLFWIHGGGFTGGLGSDPTTDGGNMASRGDVVVVTFNYRVSTLGFLALGNNQTNGNYGLGDQVTALDWVRQNIAAFGGDAEKITIMGQSAGGASVRALIASPRAKGKFRSAVPMSGPLGSYPFQSYGDYYSVQESASLFGQAVLSDTNCTGATDALKCLRSYDPYELVALPDVASSLVVDGVYLTSPSLNVTAPSGPSIPLLTGFMHDDAASFVPWLSANSTLSSILTSYGIPPLPAILSAFPTSNSSSNTTLAVFNATSRLATDAGFRCLNLASVLTGARHGVFDPSSTFIYEVDRSYMPPSYNPNPLACDAPVTSAHPIGDPTATYYKCHGGELLFVFGNLVFNQLPFRDDKDVVFARYMLDRFASFIRTGNVEPAKAFLEARGFVDEEGEKNVNFTWEKLDLQNPSFARLDWPPASRPFDEKVQCESLGVGLDYYENGGV